MKKSISLLTIPLFFFGSIFNTSQATSDDECAIWLCAPAGFNVPECATPHKIMKRRIKKGKDPFPSLASCSDNGDTGGISLVRGHGAIIPKHQETRCVQYSSVWSCRGSGYTGKDGFCGYEQKCVKKETYTVPLHVQQGAHCSHGNYGPASNKPKYCSGDYNTIRMLDENGQQIGDTILYHGTYIAMAKGDTDEYYSIADVNEDEDDTELSD